MNRREFMTLLSGATVAWPLAARAQQPGMPVIGLLDHRSPDALADRLRGFREGLKNAGFIEGQNARIEYRWAENEVDRLPELATDLVRREVTAIVAPGGLAPTLAAKAATANIPIVFIIASDPVRLGLVTSLARPGGNLTGINFLSGELTAKRLELLREMVPAANHVAVLVNAANPENTEREGKLALSGCKSRSSRPAQSARSMQRSEHLYVSGLMPSSLVSIPSLTAGASNWSTWRPATRSQRHILPGSLPKSAGS